jgi:hypothetical protein
VTINRDGRECRPWCITDHSAEGDSGDCVSSEHPASSGGAKLSQPSFRETPELRVHAFGKDSVHGAVWADTRYRAEALADFLDALSTQTPGQIRKLAQAAREAEKEEFDLEAE